MAAWPWAGEAAGYGPGDVGTGTEVERCVFLCRWAQGLESRRVTCPMCVCLLLGNTEGRLGTECQQVAAGLQGFVEICVSGKSVPRGDEMELSIGSSGPSCKGCSATEGRGEVAGAAHFLSQPQGVSWALQYQIFLGQTSMAMGPYLQALSPGGALGHGVRLWSTNVPHFSQNISQTLCTHCCPKPQAAPSG